MKAKIEKWKNGLGLPLPGSICEGYGLIEGSVVDLSLKGGNLIVRISPAESLDLEELVNGISEANIHEGFDTGGPRGIEAW